MTSFIEIGIREDILKGLDTLGFTIPTPVQEQIIPIALKHQTDIIGLAQTGTGKTAAFGIPLIQTADNSKQTQALVLCPTRELCVQVTRDMTDFARYVPGINIVAVYGGANISQQIHSIQKGAQIIVATPGRLADLIRRKKVDISAIRSVVLDEADEMLQMGFQEELDAILAETPDSKNTLLFSATMPKQVSAIANNYMKSPKEITIGKRNAGAENVRHMYYVVQAKNRYLALKRIADIHPNIYSIIFCRTRQETKEVADKLIQDGYNADALHGDLSQGQRDHVMRKFRNRNLQMLVATDVAARGLDVNDLTHVINYNLPDEAAGYTHRSGRTGRAGKAGISIAIIHMREKYKINIIEKRLKKKFEQGRIPSGNEICEKQLLSHMDVVKNAEVNHEQITPFLPTISEKLESLSREELIKKFVSLEFNRFLEYYRNAPDLNVSENTKGRQSRKTKSQHVKSKNEKFNKSGNQIHSKKFTRFLINVGRNDGVDPKRLIGKINDSSGMPNIKIGKIEIMKYSALLEADSRFENKVLNAFQYLMINGKDVSIKIAKKNLTKPKTENNRKNQKSSKKAKSRKTSTSAEY